MVSILHIWTWSDTTLCRQLATYNLKGRELFQVCPLFFCLLEGENPCARYLVDTEGFQETDDRFYLLPASGDLDNAVIVPHGDDLAVKHADRLKRLLSVLLIQCHPYQNHLPLGGLSGNLFGHLDDIHQSAQLLHHFFDKIGIGVGDRCYPRYLGRDGFRYTEALDIVSESPEDARNPGQDTRLVADQYLQYPFLYSQSIPFLS